MKKKLNKNIIYILIGILFFFAGCPELEKNDKQNNKKSGMREDTINWDKKFDGVYDEDIARKVVIDSNDNVYVIGHSKNLVSGTSGIDWWIKKFDSNGNEYTTAWNKMLNIGYYDDYAYSAAVLSNDNLYVVGSSENLISGSSNHDWCIKNFTHGGYFNIGRDREYDSNDQNDIAKSIAVDSNDNFYVVGYGGDIISETSNRDWWIKKFDSDGNEITTSWNKGIDNGGNDEAFSIAIDSNNSVYVVGIGENLISGTSYYDWWIKKFTSSGGEYTISWNKQFNRSEFDLAFSAAVDSNNNLYVVGHTNFKMWIKKFSSNGTEDTLNWNKTISVQGNIYIAQSVAIDSKNNVYVAGQGENLVSESSKSDWLIMKFNADGDIITEKFYDGNNGWDQIFSVAVDSNDNVYVAGMGEDLITNGSDYDWWIKKFINHD